MQFLKKILFSIFLFYFNISFSQDSIATNIDSNVFVKGFFKGNIEYQIQEISPNTKIISNEEFIQTHPTRGLSNLYLNIDNNKLELKYNSKIEFYNFKTNKHCVLSNVNKEDSLFCIIDGYEKNDYSILKSGETKKILGIQCKSIIYKTKFLTIKYFFADNNLKIGLGKFRNFYNNEFYYILNRIGSIPLEIEIKSNFGNKIFVAKKISKT